MRFNSRNLSLGSLISLGVVILMLISIFILPRLLSNLTRLPSSVSTRAAGQNASLALPLSQVVSPNQSFSVPIVLNTDNAAVIGVDVVLTFDRSFLTLTDINTSGVASTSLKTFVPCVKDTGGNCNGAFDKQGVISQANGDGTGTGTITFGAVSVAWGTTPAPTPTVTLTQPFTGTATIAILTFTPKKLGSTNVNFVFSAGSTVDSNIVPDPSVGNSDLLSAVTNLSLTIANPTPTLTSTPAPTITGTACASRQYGDLHSNSTGVGGCDRDVDIFDYNVMLQYFGQTGCGNLADIQPWTGGSCPGGQGNGVVNIFDYNVLLTNFGKTNL